MLLGNRAALTVFGPLTGSVDAIDPARAARWTSVLNAAVAISIAKVYRRPASFPGLPLKRWLLILVMMVVSLPGLYLLRRLW